MKKNTYKIKNQSNTMTFCELEALFSKKNSIVVLKENLK
jgi:hypothetical protein